MKAAVDAAPSLGKRIAVIPVVLEWRRVWERSCRVTTLTLSRLKGNPLADINVVINNVRWVMKGGVVVVDKTTLRKPD